MMLIFFLSFFFSKKPKREIVRTYDPTYFVKSR